jgi:prolyl oligopeptidase
VIFTANEDWNGFKAGDVLSYELATLLRDPAAARAELVLRPGPRESVEGIRITRSRVVVALYENVRGAAYAYQRNGNGWTRTRLPLPENVTVGLGSAEPRSDRLFINVSGYLTPQTLMLVDAAAGTAETVKAAPAKFDATGLVVEQHEATSKDGTKVPYFLVRRADAPRDGNLPTLLYGYGGFQISQLPGYSAVRGKLWLERGGAYAVANTRGGGEFGPAWHQAAIGPNRDRAHEDFIAVAQDLIGKRITSPRRLGIQGGSQGGLFMGVAMTRHPELFNAVIIGVPLFDMLRYHLLLAGASWMGEYGNPDIPEQREWILRYSPYQALAAGRNYPDAVHLHVHQGRPGASGPRAQGGGAAGRAGIPGSSTTRTLTAGTRRQRISPRARGAIGARVRLSDAPARWTRRDRGRAMTPWVTRLLVANMSRCSHCRTVVPAAATSLEYDGLRAARMC